MDKKDNAEMPLGPWQYNIRFSLIITLFVPVVLVISLRRFYTNDTLVLALAGIIPVIRVVVLLSWTRRVDWLGVIVAIGFGVSLAVSQFAGTSTLPLKIYHPVITGAVGIVFLISAALRRPLLLLFIKSYNISGPDHIERLKSPEVQKRLTGRTAIIGLVFLIEAAAHIVLAITLPTDAYLEFSAVVTVAAVLVLITVIRLAARRSR